jgi:hypothetical protein
MSASILSGKFNGGQHKKARSRPERPAPLTFVYKVFIALGT